jgi:hypothetical protein
MINTLVFEKNANFFAENWRKSQKIVIITSTQFANGTSEAIKIRCFVRKHISVTFETV